MSSYPNVFATLGRLSTRSEPPCDAATAGEIASELNRWMYSAGGMTAERSTRGAVLVLRELLLDWNSTGEKPPDFYDWRNRALLLLRRDLDVAGLESYDAHDMESLLLQVRKDADKVVKRRSRAPG